MSIHAKISMLATLIHVSVSLNVSLVGQKSNLKNSVKISLLVNKVKIINLNLKTQIHFNVLKHADSIQKLVTNTFGSQRKRITNVIISLLVNHLETH